MAARKIVKPVIATAVLGLVVAAEAQAGTVSHVTDSLGNDKDLFTVLETVNAWGTAEVNGSGIFGEIIPRAKLYVTPNQAWSDGAALTDLSSNGVEDIVGGLGGAFAFVVVWPAPLTPGEYDVILDDDRNGTFNVGVDGGLGLGAEYGFRVAAVPVPPAAWMLGPALAGLLLRRRRGTVRALPGPRRRAGRREQAPPAAPGRSRPVPRGLGQHRRAGAAPCPPGQS